MALSLAAAAAYLLGLLEFAVGLNRRSAARNLIGVLIALELMLLAIGLLLVDLGAALDDLNGAALALLILPLAGAESAVALSLIVAFYPARLNVLSWQRSRCHRPMVLPLLLLPLFAMFLDARRRLAIAALLFAHAALALALYDPAADRPLPAAGGLLLLDGLGLALALLTALLLPFALLSLGRGRLVLLVGFWSIAAFAAADLLLFYVAFEGVLLPMFLLIGFYGGLNRKLEAAYSLFLYTLFGSLLMLLAILALGSGIGSTDRALLIAAAPSAARGKLLWLAMFLAFAIKLPQLPFHLWLIEAHVEAPTAASVLLAAVLLKLGAYGIARFLLPIFREPSGFFRPLVWALAVGSILYASAAAIAQLDLKKIVAYSSIAHMNLALLGLFGDNLAAIVGSFYFLISHGLISAALFLLVGVLYDRFGTRTIKYYAGLALMMPLTVASLLFFTFANAAVPSTSGFIAEFITLLGAAQLNLPATAIASLSMVLTAIYAMMLFHRVSYGRLSPHLSAATSDLSPLEAQMLGLLFFLTLALGLFPRALLEPLEGPALALLG